MPGGRQSAPGPAPRGRVRASGSALRLKTPSISQSLNLQISLSLQALYNPSRSALDDAHLDKCPLEAASLEIKYLSSCALDDAHLDAVTGKTHHDAAQDFRRLSDQYPEVGTNCSLYRFEILDLEQRV